MAQTRVACLQPNGPAGQLGCNGTVTALPPRTPSRRVGRVLTQAEEVVLARRIEHGDAHAKETMIASKVHLVRAIARTFPATSVPFADLVQEGTVGLVRAVERFDHRRGVRFSTYASWWIRRAMLDAIGNARMIRIPAKAGRQLAAVRRAEAELVQLRLGPPSDARISQRTGISSATVSLVRAAPRVTVSLDEPVGDEIAVFGELVADQQAVDPGQALIDREQRADVRALLRLLPARHREVVVRRFGLDENREQTHAEIGQRLGVGEERSRQLEHEALNRLRSVARARALAA
jgi:RNA polymerase primary sigma factor